MKKHVTITEFIENNSHFIKKMRNGNKSFKAKVIFKYRNAEETEILDAIINKTTWESNKITLSEGDKINALDLHIEFDPKFPNIDFSLSINKDLIIHGSSLKLGNYEVVITCI